jgi:hypothetical protein
MMTSSYNPVSGWLRTLAVNEPITLAESLTSHTNGKAAFDKRNPYI